MWRDVRGAGQPWTRAVGDVRCEGVRYCVGFSIQFYSIGFQRVHMLKIDQNDVTVSFEFETDGRKMNISLFYVVRSIAVKS